MSDTPSSKRQKTELGSKIVVHTDGGTVDHPIGVTAEEALRDEQAIAACLDNVVVPLSHQILGSEVVLKPVLLKSSNGIRTLVETLKFMLKIAKHKTMPHTALIISKPIGSAYYCSLTDKVSGAAYTPSKDELAKLQSSMVQLVEERFQMKYMTVSCETAIENMATTGAGFTATVLKECNRSQIEIVECCDLYHVPQVPVLTNTGMVPKDSFKLAPFRDGFFLEHHRLCPKTKEAQFQSYDAVASDMLYNEYVGRCQWAQDVELYTVAQLNAAIRGSKTKKVIQSAEANCDRQFVELANQIKSRQTVKLVLIAGPSSSGKTTFAKRLQVQLEALGFRPEVLSVDNFYKAWQEINSEGAHKVDWESLDSLNLKQLNEVLLTLLSGKEALIPEYDMKVSMPADKSCWKPMQLSTKGRGLIIMEGIHCLNPSLTSAVPNDEKFKIAIAPVPALQLDALHVLSGTTIRMLRRMVRDYLNRGRSVLTTLRQWPSIAAGEVSNIYPHQGNADAMMNSEIAYEMCVLKVHVEPLLRQVNPSEPEYSEVHRLLHTLDQFIAMPTDVIPPQSLLREFVGGSWYYDYGGWYKDY
eukprot:TRINITY_DN8827_c0_g1_i1.p1 TRINITY_DN8827_c0_g1~~TRINITY_DN8827_c0_g1_i1.p1  ORF type:complete len:584 (-),score=73.14 TRINITY_DN8827_c0_g1_i1:137-1888(-)